MRFSLLILVIACLLGLGAGARVRDDAPDDSFFLGEEPVADGRFFLTADEIRAARNDVPREDLSLHSSDNSISFLSNGAEIMPRIAEFLEATQDGDFIYATFFEINLTLFMDPDPNKENNDGSRLINILHRAALRGVDVRISVSARRGDCLPGFLTSRLNGPAIAACKMVVEKLGPFHCILDQRHGHPFLGSQHQKLWAIKHGNRLTAFVGSMDVANSRWDSANHDSTDSPRWLMQNADAVRQFPWHETMYEIEGTAAEDVLTSFVSRWNDPVLPSNVAEFDQQPPQLELWLPSRQTGFKYPKGLAVQVLRTYSCRGTEESELFSNFAPQGEFTYAAAWFKALRLAKTYVLIADQFMWFPEAMTAVIEAAARGVEVYLLTNPGTVFQVKTLKIHSYQKALQYYQHISVFGNPRFQDLDDAAKGRIRMFTLVGKNVDTQGNNLIYNHEKTVIIDDEYALVGSTGVEQTGFTNDADLSIAIHSLDFVPKLRRSMLSEWLMATNRSHGEQGVRRTMSPDDELLRTPESSFREWMRQASGVEPGAQVQAYVPSSNRGPLHSAVYNFMEPDGRCAGPEFAHMWPASKASGSGSEVTDAFLQKIREAKLDAWKDRNKNGPVGHRGLPTAAECAPDLEVVAEEYGGLEALDTALKGFK